MAVRLIDGLDEWRSDNRRPAVFIHRTSSFVAEPIDTSGICQSNVPVIYIIPPQREARKLRYQLVFVAFWKSKTLRCGICASWGLNSILCVRELVYNLNLDRMTNTVFVETFVIYIIWHGKKFHPITFSHAENSWNMRTKGWKGTGETKVKNSTVVRGQIFWFCMCTWRESKVRLF